MTPLTRSVAFLTAAPSASSSRTFFTNPTILAGASKGPAKKVLSKAGAPKKVVKGYIRKGEAPGTTISGRKNVNLRFALASEVPDLGDFMQLHPESYIVSNVGRPTVFPRRNYEQLRTFGLPRKLDKEVSYLELPGLKSFSSKLQLASSGAPASVIRQQTVELVRTLNSAKAGSSKDARFMISKLAGEKGSGKSMLLLQTVSYCLEAGWIVLYAPRAANWIDSSAPYAYHPPSKTFHQHPIASSLLSTLMTINEQKLAQIKLVNPVSFDGRTVEAGSSVVDLAKLGRDEKLAVEVLASVMEVLGTQTEIPVLFAIDEAQALFQQTTYRAPDYSPIESYSLSAPLLALDYLSGRKSLSRGAVLSAPSYSTPDIHVPLILLASLDLPSPQPITPYMRYDPVHLAHASSGIKKVEVPFGMSGQEAAGMFDIWARKGWAPKATDELFMDAFAASAGNPKEMGRGLSHNFWAY